MTRKISILGSTGSIGVNTLSVIDTLKEDFDVVYLSTFQNSKLIIDQANELMRDRDLRESSDAIAFLNTEIPKSSLITMKEAINNLVQAQLEKQMLSKINTEYILKVIEPPFIPEEKSRPLRAVICIFGTLIGGILAIILVLIRHYGSGRPKTKKE